MENYNPVDSNAKILRLDKCSYEQRPDGIVVVRINKGVSVSVDDAKFQEKLFQDHDSFNLPVRLLVIPGKKSSITPEAREYLDKNGMKIVRAEAIIVQSLPMKMLVGFMIKAQKNVRPRKVFTKEVDAIKWLHSHS